MRIDHLNKEEKLEIKKLCFEFRDIFHSDQIPLSFTSEVKHHIRTIDDIPVYRKPYRLPHAFQKEADRQVEQLLAQDIIEPSTSAYNSPVIIVPKKMDASGKQKFRLAIDFRLLNGKTIDQKYPMPLINEVLEKLGKSQYFSTLDLASGFHQIQMNEGDKHKTAFSTSRGKFQFKRMPFGCRGSPITFSRCMDNILRAIHNETALVYMDDIIIFSSSLQEHIEKLRAVFERLRKYNFKVQLDKSEFLRKEVAFLGHIVTPDEVLPNPDKVAAVTNYPLPKTTKDIKAFLGLVGYYRRFIKNLAHVTKPLTNCLKKGQKIVHDEKFVEAFETCKNLLVNYPVLAYPDFDKEFIITTDASNVAIGEILSQGEVGKDRPICYISRTLNETERK